MWQLFFVVGIIISTLIYYMVSSENLRQYTCSFCDIITYFFRLLFWWVRPLECIYASWFFLLPLHFFTLHLLNWCIFEVSRIMIKKNTVKIYLWLRTCIWSVFCLYRFNNATTTMITTLFPSFSLLF